MRQKDRRAADAARPLAKPPRKRANPGADSVVVASFPPQIRAGCRVLVLGTVPSLRSLEMRQSYAHAHNLFWPMMGTLYGAGPDLPYARRIAIGRASCRERVCNDV